MDFNNSDTNSKPLDETANGKKEEENFPSSENEVVLLKGNNLIIQRCSLN